MIARRPIKPKLNRLSAPYYYKKNINIYYTSTLKETKPLIYSTTERTQSKGSKNPKATQQWRSVVFQCAAKNSLTCPEMAATIVSLLGYCLRSAPGLVIAESSSAGLLFRPMIATTGSFCFFFSLSLSDHLRRAPCVHKFTLSILYYIPEWLHNWFD